MTEEKLSDQNDDDKCEPETVAENNATEVTSTEGDSSNENSAEPETARYAVFGNPIEHSKSPQIHTAFAEQTQQDLEYTKTLVEEDGFVEAADQFFESGGRGLNITVPFKLEAFKYAHLVTDRAKTAGAANTLIKQSDGKVLADNTDGVGMVTDIAQRLGWSIKGKKVLVLGAGGAVRGVLLPLLKARPHQLVVVNRTAEKAEALADQFKKYADEHRCELKGGGYDSISTQAFDIVINGTSASLGGDLPPIPDGCFEEYAAAYDMMYGDDLTPFLSFAKDKGVKKLADGLGMLVGQAAVSFYMWRDVKPDVAPVMEMLSKQ